jgi:hypothetical protein
LKRVSYINTRKGGNLLKRDAILFIVMLLLVISVPEVQASQNVDVFDSSKFVLSQTEMPIYELITPQVNLTYTQDLARNLFGLADVLPEEEEGRYIVNSGNRSFEVDTRDGSIWYADYDKLWNVASGVDLPSPGTCFEIADSWLVDHGLLPDAAVLANIGSTNASAYNIDDGRLRSKILQYQVNYEFLQNDIPIAGDAAQISVMIGDGVSAYDRIIGFDWKWREPRRDAYATSPLIEYESILEAHGINPNNVVAHRLVYTTDDDEEKSNLLYPVWEIEIIEDDTEEFHGIHSIVYIDATLFDPVVEITTPTHGISMMPGASITFDCSVSFGTPPYTYEWSSDFDGVLSTSKSFTTVSLSEILKKDTPVPHAISVRVRDAEDRGASDCIAVTIEPVDFDMNTTLTIAVGAVAVLLVSLLVLRRRRGGFVLLFLLMMFSAFIFLPVANAGPNASGTRTYAPSAPSGAYDDGVKEVGIEWVGMSYLSKPLWNTETNIEGFYNWMGLLGGYNREFNWGEWSAWEEDFKDAQFSGTDTEWIDAVDIVYYQDHGGPDGVAFTSQHDDGSLDFSDMRLGDGDLDTIIFDACSPLAWENKDGDDVFTRWAPTLQGIHQVCSFATGSHNSATRGTKFAFYMTGFSIIPSRTIVQAWFRATLETEGSDIQSAVFYASKSPDPLNPQLDDPINDHAYGFGYVCSDPTPGTFNWYVYITSNC